MSRRRSVWRLVVVSSFAVAIVGCAPLDGAEAALGEAVCTPYVTTLVAGRTLDAGEVTASATGTELVVRLDAATGWAVDVVHLYAGTGPVPTNPGGNVAPGRFPYAQDPEPASTSVELRVPLADLGVGCGDTITIAAHADVHRTSAPGGSEGAWAYGETPFSGRQWGWSFRYVICCAPVGCTLTQGYWRNHAEEWPVSWLMLGGANYSSTELMTLLTTPARGDASLILAHQWIAAELNVASGASASTEVQDALAAAHAWLAAYVDGDGRLPAGTAASTGPGAQAVAIAGVLAAFNEGLAGAPHCE